MDDNKKVTNVKLRGAAGIHGQVSLTISSYPLFPFFKKALEIIDAHEDLRPYYKEGTTYEGINGPTLCTWLENDIDNCEEKPTDHEIVKVLCKALNLIKINSVLSPDALDLANRWDKLPGSEMKSAVIGALAAQEFIVKDNNSKKL